MCMVFVQIWQLVEETQIIATKVKNNLPAVEDKTSSQTIVKILAQCMQQGKDSYRTNHVKN